MTQNWVSQVVSSLSIMWIVCQMEILGQFGKVGIIQKSFWTMVFYAKLSCYPNLLTDLTYDLKGFKSRVNNYLLSFNRYRYVLLIFFFFFLLELHALY